MSIIKSNGFVIEQLEGLNNKFVLANGYVGLTGIMDELLQTDNAHLKVSGLTKITRNGEYYVSVFNPFYAYISVNGVVLHPSNLIPSSHEQSLDLDTGLFSRTTVYNVNGTEIKIYSERFLDQKNLNFLYSKYIFFVSKDVDLEITHGFDTEIDERYKDMFEEVSFKNDGDIILEANLKDFDRPLNILYQFERNFRHKSRNSKIKHQETYQLRAEKDRDYEIIRFVGLSTEPRKNTEYLKNALKKIRKNGYDNIFDANKIHWERLWKNRRVEIYGNELVERYYQYNQFQLISHRPRNDQSLISRYGLTDKAIDNSFTSEMYMFRYYLNTDYKAARRLLIGRIAHLKPAQDLAKKIHKKGALYTDKDQNLYLNALIVINLVDYIERTLDKSVLDVGGLEMILEISRFYMSYIELNDKKTNYQVLNAKTLDNQIDGIDNPALLNYLIRDCFGKTANMVALAKVDKRKEVEDYLKVNHYDKLIDEIREGRRKLYLQQPNVSNLIQNYDKYFKIEEQLALPDVLNLFYLYPDDFKELVKKETYLYYKKLTSPSPIGQFILSLIGVTQDDEKEANKLFRSYLPLNVYDNANKLNHLQNYLDLGLSSAIYLYLVYGLAKLRHEKYLLMADALTPSDIRRLEFKVRVARNLASVKIKRNSAIIEWNEKLEQ
ncbi:MAG: hypothetical protein AB7U52_01390 [Candidatus Izemoplasmatales bacterium]